MKMELVLNQISYTDRRKDRQNGDNEEWKKKQIRNWLVDSVKGRNFQTVAQLL